MKDIVLWLDKRRAERRRKERAQKRNEAYQALVEEDVEAGEASNNGEAEDEENENESPVATAAELAKELTLVEDQCEELEMKLRVQARKSTSEATLQIKEELKGLQERRAELRELVNGVGTVSEAPKEPPAKTPKAKVSEQPEKREPSMLVKILKSSYIKGALRTFGGTMAIMIYFADLISDVQVLTLLYSTGNYAWSYVSASLLIAQFLVVYLRVLPYLSTTFGSDSALYITFLWLGFPTGLLLLDFLMFLEPFGLLTILPFPDWLRQFVPAYKATRIIAEVAIESLPQCIMQACIYTLVIRHMADGTATPQEVNAPALCPLFLANHIHLPSSDSRLDRSL